MTMSPRKLRTAAKDQVQERIRAVRNGDSRELDLFGFKLTQIPQEVFALSDLESLFLGSNEIRAIPETIRKLSRLKLLDVSQNPIEKVPDIPGLSLDWDAYVRCRPAVSRENVVGIGVLTGERQD